MKRLLIAFLLIGFNTQAQVLVGTGPRPQPNYILPTFQQPGMMMGQSPGLQGQFNYGFGLNRFLPARYPMPFSAMPQPLNYSQALQPPGLLGGMPNQMMGPGIFRPFSGYPQAPMGMGMIQPPMPTSPMGGFMPTMAPMFNGGLSGGLSPGAFLGGGANNFASSTYCPSCNLRRERMTDPIMDRPYTPPPIAQRDIFTEAGTQAVPPPTQRVASTDRVATVDDATTAPAAAPLPATKVATVRLAPPASQQVAGRTTTRQKSKVPGLSPRRNVELSPAELVGVRARTRDEVKAQNAPVWKTFMANFAVCAPGCVPWDYAAYGERSNRSCHPSGRAIDIHGMVCNGRLYKAIDQGRFSEMMACMHGKMYTIYHNKPYSRATITSGHWDHGHFSLGCNVNGAFVW